MKALRDEVKLIRDEHAEGRGLEGKHLWGATWGLTRAAEPDRSLGNAATPLRSRRTPWWADCAAPAAPIGNHDDAQTIATRPDQKPHPRLAAHEEYDAAPALPKN